MAIAIPGIGLAVNDCLTLRILQLIQLAWFHMDAEWFQRSRATAEALVRDDKALADAKETEGGTRTSRPFGQRILGPLEGILPDLTKRDEPIFTGLAAVKVMLRPVTSRDRMSSS